jgi:hypothetical protein
MLSSAGMMHEMLANQPGLDKASRDLYDSHREIAATLADEIVNRKLVELPVVSKGRGRG